jgi:hypothetical protein
MRGQFPINGRGHIEGKEGQFDRCAHVSCIQNGRRKIGL